MKELTAAILPEAEIAPTVRLDCRSAVLKDIIPAREAISSLFEEKRSWMTMKSMSGERVVVVEEGSVPDVVRFGREEFPLKSALPNERLVELKFVLDDKIVRNLATEIIVIKLRLLCSRLSRQVESTLTHFPSPMRVHAGMLRLRLCRIRNPLHLA